MKKRIFKSLKLNKKSISNFHNEKIKGGITKTGCTQLPTCYYFLCAPDRDY